MSGDARSAELAQGLLLPGIVSVNPPILECADCERRWDDGGRRKAIAYAVIQSGNSGWGFLRCCEPTRRCGTCNAAHRASHDHADESESVLQLGTPRRNRRRKVGLR